MTPKPKYRDRLLTAAYEFALAANEFAKVEADCYGRRTRRGPDPIIVYMSEVDAIMEEICEREDALLKHIQLNETFLSQPAGSRFR